MRPEDAFGRHADADELTATRHRAPESALSTYLLALKSHWVIFTLIVLTTVAAGVAWTSARTSSYEAVARILVSPVPADDRTFVGVQVVRDSGDPTRTVQTAATLVESHKAAARTARRLGPGWSAEQVSTAVTVEPLGQSNVLAVRAEAETSEEAARVATQFARSALAARSQAVRSQVAAVIPELEAQQRELGPASSTAADLATRISQLRASRSQGDPTLTLEQSAPRGAVVGASGSLIIVLSLIAGVALGAAAVVLLELARTRVRDTEEASALFPLPILARVPKVSGRGRNAALRRDGALQRAFQRVFLQLGKDGDGRAIMMTSASRGDGTTTSAVHLASTMAFAGKRVILLDFDLRSPGVAQALGMGWNVPPLELADPEATLEQALIPVPDVPLWVLSVGPASAAPGVIEPLVDRLPALIEEARRRADFVVIDTAALGEVSDALPVLQAVDDVIVITRPGHTDRTAYEAMRDLMQRMGAPVRGLVVVDATQNDLSAHFRRSGRRDPAGDAQWQGQTRFER